MLFNDGTNIMNNSWGSLQKVYVILQYCNFINTAREFLSHETRIHTPYCSLSPSDPASLWLANSAECNIIYHQRTTHVFTPLVNMGVVKQENQTLRPSFFWVVNTAYVRGWLQTLRDSLFVQSSTAKSRNLEEGKRSEVL